VIERCGLLRDQRGVAQRHEIDIGAELQTPADDRRLRQLQQRIEDRNREGDMVADPERIIAAIIDKPDQRLHLVDCRLPGRRRRLGAAMDVLDADAEPGFERQRHGVAPCR
jgi:aldehyde:ferredoxin oxidoreductase